MKIHSVPALSGQIDSTPRLIALLGLGSLLLMALVGCKSQPHVAQNAALEETYVLVSVDNQPVPCNVTHGRTRMLIKTGAFILRPDGTCRSTICFVLPEQPERTREVAATYTKQGDTLNMRWHGAGRTIGQLSGNQFTMTNEGMVFAYHK